MRDDHRRYVRDPQGQALIWKDGSTWRYYLHDAHPGSIAAATDAQGAVSARYSYDPFGAHTDTPGPHSDLLFAEAQYSHSLLLYRIGERWYDAKLGRWTQQDPLHQPYDPREANRYVYLGTIR